MLMHMYAGGAAHVAPRARRSGVGQVVIELGQVVIELGQVVIELGLK